MTTSKPKQALAILPTLNEAKNLPLLIPKILAHGQFRLLIVDDHSSDGTGAIADELAGQFPGRITVIHRTGRRAMSLLPS